MEKKELVVGKRYQWPDTIPGGRMLNGLFTGNYDKLGRAVLITRNNDEWHVPAENCSLVPKKGR